MTNDELTVLFHFGADRQETRTLVWLEQPPTESKPSAEATPPTEPKQ